MERTAGASVVVVGSVAGTVGVGKAETVEVDQGRQAVVKMGVKQVCQQEK